EDESETEDEESESEAFEDEMNNLYELYEEPARKRESKWQGIEEWYGSNGKKQNAQISGRVLAASDSESDEYTSLKSLSKKVRRDLIDDAFNRYSLMTPTSTSPPVTKEAVQLMKARMRALDARPSRRQKMKADNKLKKALKKATIVADDEDVPDRTKLRDASKIMKKALAKKTKRPEVVVARNMNRGLKGRPKGVKGRYKMVDGVTKKEKRNEKAREKKNKKRR
ncbi:ribosomal RNA methyltransferase, partial [Chytridium lagenaria]